MSDVASSVSFGNSVSGAWLKEGKGEVCIYSDKCNTSIVIGNYPSLSSNPVFMKTALVCNKNGEVLLQTSEDGKEYKFTELDPQRVAQSIRGFLAGLVECKI